MANFKNDEEMSMEDILSSIRKYVAEEDSNKSNPLNQDYVEQPNLNTENNSSTSDEDVIILGKEDVADTNNNAKCEPINEAGIIDSVQTNVEKPTWNNETLKHATSQSSSPFNKLAEALRTYGKHKKNPELRLDMTIEQFFSSIVEAYLQRWIDNNLNKMVEDIIKKEIDRLKSE